MKEQGHRFSPYRMGDYWRRYSGSKTLPGASYIEVDIFTEPFFDILHLSN